MSSQKGLVGGESESGVGCGRRRAACNLDL